MPAYKGRSSRACHYCRRQKVKCSGEHPCSKCRFSRRECIFPSRESAALMVPENYLRELENEVAQLRQSLSNAQRGSEEEERDVPKDKRSHPCSIICKDTLIEDSTTEHFIQKLKDVYYRQTSAGSTERAISSTPSTNLSGIPSGSDDQLALPGYTYVPLDYDDAETRVCVKLPSHSYALYQLSQFESFIGSDYHWFRKQRFREKMEAAYHTSKSQIVDRTWLCCFSVALALGESYNDSSSPSFVLGDNIGIRHDSPNGEKDTQREAPPGIELFKQGLRLLKISYEEPAIEQVEALNLIAFYSYSLNRRKTSYHYAGMAHRLAAILRLSNPRQTSIEAADSEHRKRVWWTTVCMELMTCTELSLRPAFGLDETHLGFLDNTQLSTQDREDFSEPQYLTAQVKLCRIKYRVLEAVSELRSGSREEAYGLINPCLQSLKNWREEFQSLSLDFCEAGRFSTSTLGDRSIRTIASLILRYNQCYILLLRPLLLRQLHSVVQDGNDILLTNDLTRLNNECLRAAMDNASIQSALSICHRLAKFGFWESLHIFSSLTILVISSFVMEKCPAAFSLTVDREVHQTVRDLLREMARLGNNASRDHERMIQDIENLFPTGSVYTGPADGLEGLIGWSDYLEFGDIGFDSIEPSTLLHG